VKENRFFRFVWRVNGLSLLLLAMCLIAIGGYELVGLLFSANKPPIVQSVADDPGNKEGWHLGEVHEIPGSQYLFVPLVSENKNVKQGGTFAPAAVAQSSRWPGYYQPSRNVLFIDSDTMDMKWLFGGNGQLIASINLLATKPSKPDDKARAILYLVIKNDTNHNGILDESDLSSIAISNAGGAGCRELVSSADRLIDARLVGQDSALILYQAKGVAYAMNIRLDNHSSSKPVQIPKVHEPS
jgi:hypothetical protein